MRNFTKLLIVLIWIFVVFPTNATWWPDVDDCKVNVEVLEVNIEHDTYSDWYYEMSWETKGSRSTGGWSKVLIITWLSDNEYCKEYYPVWNELIIQFDNDYNEWDILQWGANASGDEFTYSTFLNDVVIRKQLSELWDPVAIRKYKVIFNNRLKDKIDNISDEKFELVLEKINNMLLQYSESVDTAQSKKIIISQLIALKEIIEENYR